jgi:hypothetical protein
MEPMLEDKAVRLFPFDKSDSPLLKVLVAMSHLPRFSSSRPEKRRIFQILMYSIVICLERSILLKCLSLKENTIAIARNAVKTNLSDGQYSKLSIGLISYISNDVAIWFRFNGFAAALQSLGAKVVILKRACSAGHA